MASFLPKGKYNARARQWKIIVFGRRFRISRPGSNCKRAAGRARENLGATARSNRASDQRIVLCCP